MCGAVQMVLLMGIDAPTVIGYMEVVPFELPFLALICFKLEMFDQHAPT